MADKKTYTGLSKNYATVPAFSITTIDYLDTKPNYFRVQNRGTTEIYCSTNNMPTTKHYDFAVAGKKMKMFAEPYNRTRLYIFNPSGSDVEVAVLSFQAEFEPLTLALSEIEVEMPKDFESSMAITSFNAPLPTGNNKIGKVEVTNFNNPLPTGNNKIGKVEVTNGVTAADVTVLKENTQVTAENTQVTAENTASAKTLSQTIVNLLGELLSPTYVDGKLNILTIMDGFISLRTTLEDRLSPIYYQSNTISFEKKNQNEEILLIGNKTGSVSNPFTIKMLTNDGEGDLVLKMKASLDISETSLTLKPGESISDLRLQAEYIAVSGTNYSFRALITNEGIG